jgi:hypothetical protein
MVSTMPLNFGINIFYSKILSSHDYLSNPSMNDPLVSTTMIGLLKSLLILDPWNENRGMLLTLPLPNQL